MLIALHSPFCAQRGIEDVATATTGDLVGSYLHAAVTVPGMTGLVQQLVALGVPVNATNKDGDASLHVAGRAGNMEVRCLEDLSGLSLADTCWQLTWLCRLPKIKVGLLAHQSVHDVYASASSCSTLPCECSIASPVTDPKHHPIPCACGPATCSMNWCGRGKMSGQGRCQDSSRCDMGPRL